MEPFIVRTSDRQIFKNCRRRWNWASKIRMNLEPAFPPQPMEFGSAIHVGQQVYYDPEFWDKPRDVVERMSVAAFANECNRQKGEYLKAVNDEGLDPDRQRDFDDELFLGTKMMEHYFQWAPTQDTFTPVRVEIEFEVPVLKPDGNQLFFGFQPVIYQGRVDLLAEDEWGYWIIDHKTTGQMSATDWLELDEQGGSYCWALSKMLNLPIQGVIYNRLLKDYPKPPDRLQKKREGRWFSVNKQMRCTFELYLRTLNESGEPIHLYRDHLQYLQDRGNPFFQRVTTRRSRRQQELQGLRIVDEAVDMYNDPSIYPSPGPFTCMGCAYKAPCLIENDGGDTTLTLDTLFRKRK